MVYNQLFKIIPDRSILVEILQSFGISDLDENIHFTNEDLNKLNTCSKILDLSNRLKEYYIPCKSKLYLNKIDNKRAITILKQFLKVHEYSIVNKYKTIDGVRHKYFIIHKNSEKVIVPKKKILISFD